MKFWGRLARISRRDKIRNTRRLLGHCTETADLVCACPGNGSGYIAKTTYDMVSYRKKQGERQSKNYLNGIGGRMGEMRLQKEDWGDRENWQRK